MRRVCGPAGTSAISKRPSASENACCPVDCTLTRTATSGAPVRASTITPVTRPVTGCSPSGKALSTNGSKGKDRHDRKTKGNHQGCDHDSGQLGIAVNCRARTLPEALRPLAQPHSLPACTAPVRRRTSYLLTACIAMMLRLAAVPVRVEHARAVGRHRESRPRIIADPRDIDAGAAGERRAPDHRLISGGAEVIDAGRRHPPVDGFRGANTGHEQARFAAARRASSTRPCVRGA